jgi:hypothetical protein
LNPSLKNFHKADSLFPAVFHHHSNAFVIDFKPYDYRFNSVGRQVLTKDDFIEVAKRCSTQFPQSALHFQEPAEMFDKYDTNKSGTLELSEIGNLIKMIDKNLTALPATAQVRKWMTMGSCFFYLHHHPSRIVV